MDGYYSRRINVQHRLVYRVIEDKHQVIVHAMWSHYGD
ncbi:MAG: type II toxin-antitoxin system YoeB family toxin [Candidatus Enterosoma sp.]|nr:type II toxin-antitoxin system YoeB family toxin [Candidatus Enterosoma sp.]